MKEIKDLFSAQATTYATFRPMYPDSLYEFLYHTCSGFDTAWDCGTGNGQVANRLAERFNKVYATDISPQQIANASIKSNIEYCLSRAEQSPIAAKTIGLITIGTALHWFDFEGFYKEVKRVAKPGAVIAAWCYAPFRSVPAIDTILDDFYENVVGSYWDAERRYVDQEYKTIPFPFKEIECPPMEIKAVWKREQFTGFLQSWSAVQHYIQKNNQNPVDIIMEKIAANWDDVEVKEIIFPLFIRAGYVE